MAGSMVPARGELLFDRERYEYRIYSKRFLYILSLDPKGFCIFRPSVCDTMTTSVRRPWSGGQSSANRQRYVVNALTHVIQRQQIHPQKKGASHYLILIISLEHIIPSTSPRLSIERDREHRANNKKYLKQSEVRSVVWETILLLNIDILFSDIN